MINFTLIQSKNNDFDQKNNLNSRGLSSKTNNKILLMGKPHYYIWLFKLLNM